MTALSLLLNLAAYSAQVACIVVIGGLAATLLRIDVPAVRYAYWRAVLAVSLGLPWLQGRIARTSGPAAAIGTIDVATAPAAAAVSAPHASAAAAWWPGALVAVVIAGAVLRLLWIAGGLLRLRRLRREGALLALTPIDETFRRSLAPQATVREVSGLRQPVTFGWRHPVVLVPDRLRSHEAPVREAVLCHEFHHVDRRDWPWVLVEQIITSIFWFHPAMWWAVSRVQLAREEVVDELVVRATGSRRTYIEALMAFADDASRMPVAAFARRRHLFGRIQLIAKERVMSVPRLAFSSVLLTAVTAAAVWFSAAVFPLSAAAPQQVTQTPGPLEQIATPVAANANLPRPLSQVRAVYPLEALAVDASGAVIAKIVVDQNGQVAEIRPVGLAIGTPTGSYHAVREDPLPSTERMFGANDPMKLAADAFLSSTQMALSDWRFEPPSTGPVSFYVMITLEKVGSAGRQFTQASTTMPVLPAMNPSGIARQGGRGIADNGVAGGVTTQSGRGSGGARGGQAGPSAAGRAAATATPSFTSPPPPPPPPAPGAQGRILAPVRVGGNIQQPKKIKDVAPVYPPIALSARVQGVVIIEATIDVDGSVVDTKILRSIPLLDQAAIDAVRQWRFVPTLLNGQPTPIIMSMTVSFQLDSLQ
jgi:TonB family protein